MGWEQFKKLMGDDLEDYMINAHKKSCPGLE